MLIVYHYNQYLYHPSLRVRSVYQFHVYFHRQKILHHIGISLPHEDGFNKLKDVFKRRFYRILGDYGVNMKEIRIIDAECCTSF